MRVLLLVVCLAVASCSARRSDIEEPDEFLTCSPGFVNIADMCYTFHQDHSNWVEAGHTCSTEGARLASVITAAQYKGILAHLNANFPGTYWTSGAVVDGRWIWTANGKSVASQWWGRSPSNRNNQCAYFCSNTHKYWDKSCDRKLRFICQKDLQLNLIHGVKAQ